jgi:hypothetical protein
MAKDKSLIIVTRLKEFVSYDKYSTRNYRSKRTLFRWGRGLTRPIESGGEVQNERKAEHYTDRQYRGG